MSISRSSAPAPQRITPGAPAQIRVSTSLGGYYIFPEHQQKGLGTNTLLHVLRMADEAMLPVRLEYLKWNPVGSLYLRNGFRVTHETETHYHLERKSTATNEKPDPGG